MKLTLFFRKAFPDQYSIEQVFRSIADQLPDRPAWYTLPHASKSILPRLQNGWAARRSQGDVNHITGDITYIAPFLKKSKTVITFHDFDFIKRSRGLKRWLLFCFWVYLPVRRAQYITTISQATKADLLQLIKLPPSKIWVIPNPLTLVKQPKLPVAQKNTLPVVLHIGTKANKNLERLIPALSGLDIQLRIVGELKPEQTILLHKHQINYHNSWKLSKAALIQQYQQADLLAFVSTIEGFGLPIVEAQALGCPVLTSNLSSMPEVAGEGAYLVNPYDAAAIRAAVQALLKDDSLREKLIEKGYENVKRFQPKHIALQYMALYEKVAKA